ncbi:hypothetical protein GCM10009133_36970 [Cocleimonas flava]|uniref:Uncharacterized protein n=1 Tax=Cocleimonas flava TaxID=634765 RepID=A0A4R1F3T1_9GAMM|nr:hypothetical protein [Cocleimonas flava]TCJ88463.1 hypothetical protein EV695_0317 [Cocleimonas flava]
MWHSPYKLYLYPETIKQSTDENEKAIGDFSSISKTLKELDFIGTKQGERRYTTGKNFVSLLTFMGCSPNIELEPQENKPYCYIEIIIEKEAKFFSGINIKAATCPECKAKITDIANPAVENSVCTNCKKTFKTNRLNWRKTAFIAQYCIVIGNIYESEAIPNDQLLDALKATSLTEWRYAYIREDGN